MREIVCGEHSSQRLAQHLQDVPAILLVVHPSMRPPKVGLEAPHRINDCGPGMGLSGESGVQGVRRTTGSSLQERWGQSLALSSAGTNGTVAPALWSIRMSAHAQNASPTHPGCSRYERTQGDIGSRSVHLRRTVRLTVSELPRLGDAREETSLTLALDRGSG
jgi:hypothetical protein